jgi:lysophospholipase L1-like esterase
MPASFKGTKPNVIIDSANCLSPFFEKLLMLRNPDNTEKPVVRIVHIGDSHVRSHEFTPALNFPLTENFGNAAIGLIAGYRSEGILEESGSPGVICQCIGINGATSQNFLDDVYLSQIQRLQPDLIIISLGTNESIGNYSSSSHYDAMENLYSALKNDCPAAAILYTTPPGAFRIRYGKYRRHRRVYTKVISIDENRNIRKVAATITRFAADHGAACWDLFNIAGGNEYACQNWLTGNYFQRDRLHFVSDGYALQGNLLYEALMNGYNEYVNRHE